MKHGEIPFSFKVLHESLILEYFLQLVTVTSYTFFLEKKKITSFVIS